MNTDRFDHVFIQPGSYETSLAFYRDALGWAVRSSWGGGDSPRGAILSSGQMTLVIAEDHPVEDSSKSKGINGTRPTLHIAVQDVQAKYTEVSKVGRTLFPPERNHWGTIWFVAQDPDGNLVAFEEK